MIVGLLTFELFIPEAGSLKSKRYVIRSIKDRLKKYNVSVAEEASNLWQRSVLSVVCVTNDTSHLYSTFEKIKRLINSEVSVEVLNVEMELL
ncbi:hypothetical protein BMS3Bbin06_00183 [bacterium BMS3Bbin06]|nr:hypothetical protein BMS3Bbin06_00183 [bacterium BMS3Bbin06]HDO36216.1 DUF503 domain-containing protein [Nitrospirota bacterium]